MVIVKRSESKSKSRQRQMNSKLKERNYMDFLSPPPGKGKKLQLHCWHVFVPDYNHSRGEVPEEYNPEVDNELVPPTVAPAKYQPNQIPDCTEDQLDNSVIEVEDFNIKDNTDFFEDVSFCRGHRDSFGTPLNMKGRKYTDVWKEKAKNMKHQMIMEDVKKILGMVFYHFRDHIVRKRITESLPEINPTRENADNVWVITGNSIGLYLKLVKNETVVISHIFPPDEDPEDEDAHVDPQYEPPPPLEVLPEKEEVIVKLKFTSYTSDKIRKYYTEVIENRNTQQAQNPQEQFQFPHSEWTPGRPTTFTRQLQEMLEGGDSGDQVTKRLTFDETPEEQRQREEAEREQQKGDREKAEREKQEREHEEAERAKREKEEQREHEDAFFT